MTRTEFAVLAVIVVMGLVLRLLPWLRDPAIALRDDAAYHVRLVNATVLAGRVPEVDVLSEAPGGRRLAEHLPLGLYGAGAAFHRALAPLDHMPVRTHVIVLIALTGALIALPVHLATRALGAGVRPALIAALIAACLPAHLHRTFGHWVRYDAPGTLLIAMHVAFALRALQGDGAYAGPDRARAPGSTFFTGGPPRWIDGALSAAFLIAAAAVWRVSLLLPVLEAAYVLLVVFVRGADMRMAAWFGMLAVTCTVAFAAMDPMRSQQFVRSGAWVFVIASALAAVVSALRPSARMGLRAVVAGAALTVAFAAAWLLPAGAYDATFDVLKLKLARLLHLGDSASPLSRLMLDVIELYSLSPTAFMFGPQQFFALGPWFVAVPFVLIREGRRAGADLAAAFASPGGLLAFLCVALSALTLLFSRNKVLLAPWVAVTCGWLAMKLLEPAAREVATATLDVPGAARRRGRSARPVTPHRGARRAAGAGRLVLGNAFALSIAATIACGGYLSWTRVSHADPALEAAAEFLRDGTNVNAIVAAPWWYGYDVQTLAGRATLADGLLESRENQRRILELYAAFLAPDPAELAAFCRAHRVTHVLVPPPDEFTNVAWIAAPAIAEHIAAGRDATPDELRRTLVRMMRREPVAGVAVAYENDRFRVLALVSPDATSGDRP